MATKNYGKDGSGKVRTAAGDKDGADRIGSGAVRALERGAGAVRDFFNQIPDANIKRAAEAAESSKPERDRYQQLKDRKAYRG